MRVIFMGTPAFAVPSLEALASNHEVIAVFTRPDAVRSRGRELEPSPVKVRAEELGIPVCECSRISPDEIDAMRELAPDLIAVAAYGAILPDPMLEVAPKGCINVHASLLPRWRGAAPIQRAILAGDEVAGVSIMDVVHDLDAGAYCAQASTPIAEKGAAELIDELSHLGADLLISAIAQIGRGEAVWTEQDESLVTYAHKVEKPEMLLSPEDTAAANRARVQASGDAAPARCLVAKRGVRILDARISAEELGKGEVRVVGKRVFLGCSDGALEVLEVKPDGKREMAASAWAAGLRDAGQWAALS